MEALGPQQVQWQKLKDYNEIYQLSHYQLKWLDDFLPKFARRQKEFPKNLEKVFDI